MMLGATAFEGVVCNSSADICASDDFAKMGLTPAPSTSRLKSRRFMMLPHSLAKGLLVDGHWPLAMRQIYSTCVVILLPPAPRVCALICVINSIGPTAPSDSRTNNAKLFCLFN